MHAAWIAIALWSLGGAAETPGAGRPVLFDKVTPANALVLLPKSEPSRIVPLFTHRRVVSVWGYPTAFLHYTGRDAGGQFARRLPGGAWLCCVARDDKHEADLFLTEVLPAITSPREVIETPQEPTQLITPKTHALRLLQNNVLRAYFGPRLAANDLNSQGARGKLIRQWIEIEQCGGLLHEVQHAFVAHGRPGVLPQWENEERSHLTAMRHSPSPQIVLFRLLRQYDAGEGIYYEAVRDILANLVRRIAERPGRYPRINTRRNIVSQLDAISGDDLAEMAGQIMRARWEAWDVARGLSLEYERPQRIDTAPGFRLDNPESELRLDSPPPARQISVSAVSGQPELTGAILVANANRPPLQETWGKSHWRLQPGMVLAAVFTPPASANKATLRVVHMATTDSQGQGGKTFICILVNNKTLGEAHEPPQEKDNRLQRPETFDISGFLRPGKPNLIVLACDPRKHSDLVYWVESFEMVFE